MNVDLKDIVKNSYTSIIKGTINKIIHLNIDSILNELVGIHVKSSNDLIITDKFYIFQNLWKAILETLYSNFLPDANYKFTWKIEATPYALLLCELNDTTHTEELEHFKRLSGVTDAEIEEDFDTVAEKLGLTRMDMPNGAVDILPSNLVPKTRKEQLLLLFRIMNFPPLSELALFFMRYNSKVQQQYKTLSDAFIQVNTSKLPDFGLSEPMHKSYFQLDHKIFKKYGIRHFQSDVRLSKFQQAFEKIISLARRRKGEFKDEFICPCCGDKQTIVLSEEVLEYKLLLENQELCREIGLLYQKDVVDNYMESMASDIGKFITDLNVVDNPSCLILVEGESEEISIPLLAFRKRFILSSKDIQVYNSKSKQKLKEDFLSFKNKYPKRKIICLLDADAVKEKNDIERIIKNQKNKYHLVFIDKGTYEDLFDLETSVKVINDLYPEGDPLSISDFESGKDFLSNISKLLYVKKKSTFDKVLFAKTISLKLDLDRLPSKLEEVFNKAKEFSYKPNFLKS